MSEDMHENQVKLEFWENVYIFFGKKRIRVAHYSSGMERVSYVNASSYLVFIDISIFYDAVLHVSFSYLVDYPRIIVFLFLYWVYP